MDMNLRKFRVRGTAIASDGREISTLVTIEAQSRIAANLLAYSRLCGQYPDDNLEPLKGSWRSVELTCECMAWGGNKHTESCVYRRSWGQ